MSVKFSLGPWITEESLTPDGKGTGTYDVHQNTEDGHWVAFTGTVHNARLIAVAPDMLLCLRNVIDSHGEVDQDLWNRIREVIANATGEAS